MTLKEQAWKVFATWVKMRGAMEDTGGLEKARCVTCDILFPLALLDAGHCIGGRHNGILFEPNAVHPQCHSCNRLHGGRYGVFEVYIRHKFGDEEWERLTALSKQIKHYWNYQYVEIIVLYREKIKELKQN